MGGGVGRGGCEEVRSGGMGLVGVGRGEETLRGLVPHPVPAGLAEVFSVMIMRGMSSPAFSLAEWSGLRRVNISSWYSPSRRERGWSGLLWEMAGSR